MSPLRFSRDKRGYEHTFLVDSARRAGTDERILYWFRTPPNVRVGRSGPDEEALRLVQASRPDLRIEWDQLTRVAQIERQQAPGHKRRDAGPPRRRPRPATESGAGVAAFEAEARAWLEGSEVPSAGAEAGGPPAAPDAAVGEAAARERPAGQPASGRPSGSRRRKRRRPRPSGSADPASPESRIAASPEADDEAESPG